MDESTHRRIDAVCKVITTAITSLGIVVICLQVYQFVQTVQQGEENKKAELLVL